MTDDTIKDCAQCGGQPEAHHIVCPSCGAALRRLGEVDLWWCRHCGGGIHDCNCAPTGGEAEA